MTEPVNKNPAVAQRQGEDDHKETVDRRRMMFGAGLLGMLVAACSGTDFSGGAAGLGRSKKKETGGGDDDAADGPDDGGNEGKDTDDDGGALDVDDDTASSGEVDVDTGLDACAANSTTEIDPNGDDIGDMKPRMKFYGRMDSALVALKFEGTEEFGQVILCTPKGKLLAVHTITGADKDANGKYRPIVMDNIWLKENGKDLEEVKVIIQKNGMKKVHTEKIEFFTTFGGKPVVDLSGRTVPAEMIGRQSVTQFDASTNAFTEDTNVTYPNDFNAGTIRNLRTVNQSTVWSKGAGVMGTVTDIMGDTIDIGGAAILEYQVFCTYVDAGGQVVRTILHIG